MKGWGSGGEGNPLQRQREQLSKKIRKDRGHYGRRENRKKREVRGNKRGVMILEPWWGVRRRRGSTAESSDRTLLQVLCC